MKRILLAVAILITGGCQPADDPAADAGTASRGETEAPGADAAAPVTEIPAATADAARQDAVEEDPIGLELPATFTGTLPCADCPGIAWHVDLWPDGVFHLKREYLERDATDFDLGRWRKDPARDAILLYGGREMPLAFSIEGPRTLELLDVEGRPIESELSYELNSDGTLAPVDLRIAFHGLFRYMADAALFQECLTGRSYPVAMEGAYIDLERAYLAADKREPGAPILAFVEGEITARPPMEGDRDVPTLVVKRFDRLDPDQGCEQAMSEASLVSTYWKITAMAGDSVEAVDNRREPHVVLRSDEPRYAATVGCNQVTGAYEINGDKLIFNPGPTTLMACPPPLDELERTLIDTLAATRSFKITGQTLELFDEAGDRIAVMEAVYLP